MAQKITEIIVDIFEPILKDRPHTEIGDVVYIPISNSRRFITVHFDKACKNGEYDILRLTLLSKTQGTIHQQAIPFTNSIDKDKYTPISSDSVMLTYEERNELNNELEKYINLWI